jgi:anti-sigma B factor antagonist
VSIKSHTVSDGKIAIIEIKGSLIGDELTDNFRELVADFIEQGNRSLIINLEKLNYMNSSGIGAIISAYTSYKKNGGEVKLVGVSQNIQNILAVTRLVELFDVHDKLNDAIQSYSDLNSK